MQNNHPWLRTDLALEVKESFPNDQVEINGVRLTETYQKEIDLKISTVCIQTASGAAAMKKPMGSYITLESPTLLEGQTEKQIALTKEIAKTLQHLIQPTKKDRILIVGLGNRNITPDAIGPFVIDQLYITRHLIREFGSDFQTKYQLANISAIAPGVMAQTGMECSELLKGIISETNPSLVIAIDALAARSVHRLATTIQITDTGICPGSGIGNHRTSLDRKTLGIPVFAIGIPTVIESSTIIGDAITQFCDKQGFQTEQIQGFCQELCQSISKPMFVTPKDIDDSVRAVCTILSDALYDCFFTSL